MYKNNQKNEQKIIQCYNISLDTVGEEVIRTERISGVDKSPKRNLVYDKKVLFQISG